LLVPVRSKKRQNDPVQQMLLKAMDEIESIFNISEGRRYMCILARYYNSLINEIKRMTWTLYNIKR